MPLRWQPSMLRITEQPATGDASTVLRLEGRIAGLWVSELRREVRNRRQRDRRPLVLDLEQVSFIDKAGLDFFDEVGPEVFLINCSLFAAEQLKDVMQRHRTVRS